MSIILRYPSLFTLVLLAVLQACARPPRPVAIRTGTIAVLPVYNDTGDSLIIAGESLLEKYLLRTERYTVPDALAAVARVRLARQGFAVMPAANVDAALGNEAPESAAAASVVAARNGIDGAVLYVEIRRWEPDTHFEPRFVIASVRVQLIDVATGKIIWSGDQSSRPVKTPGAINFGQAYAIAAETVMIEMLAPLRPAGVVGEGG